MAAPDFQLFSSLRYDPLLLTLSANTEAGDPTMQAHHPSAINPSPFYMASYHRDRILQAAEHFRWTAAADKLRGPPGLSYFLQQLHAAITVDATTALRVRVLLAYDGVVTVESNPAAPVSGFNLFPQRIPPPRSAARAWVSPLTGGALTVGEGDAVYGDPDMRVVWEIIPDTARTTPSAYTAYKTTSRDMYSLARERVGIKDMAEKREVLIVSDRDGEVMEGSLTSVFFWRDGKWTTPPLSSGGQAGTTRRWALEKGLCVEGVVRVQDLVEGEECWISNGVRGFSLGKVTLS